MTINYYGKGSDSRYQGESIGISLVLIQKDPESIGSLDPVHEQTRYHLVIVDDRISGILE